MEEESIFGLHPEQLDRLLSLGTDDKPADIDRQKTNAHRSDAKLKYGDSIGSGEKNQSSEATISLSAIVEQPGGWINHYKLLSALGEGGMGIVYLAEQDHPIQRQVALKVIKPGMDSKRIIARFEAERQALALLEHPNIAHVYDAGTTETGRPYFVMEYVKGSPITEYCDRHKLSIEERLNLFRQVCLAVHHAHQKGIIHRDIKPSNILVSLQDDQAVPKIIDFGVAKAVSKPLSDSTLFTEQGHMVGTPEYMSPEQADAASEDIDTRSDIYSLGVVLYQLLTGVLPFDSDTLREGGIDNARKVICEQDPKTPSTRLRSLGKEAESVAQQRQTDVTSLTRQLHRELEWIPLKAVRKDRTRRYRSAAEFADDIELYLQGAPLIAGPESVTYRAGKFIKRHRIPVIAIGSAIIVLLLAAVVSTALYMRAVSAAEYNRRLLYVNQITLAHSAYREADIDRAQQILMDCPTDLREFAWSYLWRLSDINPALANIPHPNPVNAVAFSPTGGIIATASGKTIRLWDASTHNLKDTLEGHNSNVRAIAFSPDGKMLVSGGKDPNAILWNVVDGRKIRPFNEQTGPVVSLAFSSDGKTIAAGISSGQVVLWQVSTGESESISLFKQSENTIYSITLSPDDTLLAATCTQETILLDLTSHQTKHLKGHGTFVNSAAFLSDGRTLATTGNDGTLRFWDIDTTKELAKINAHSTFVTTMAVSPDGKLLATGSADSTIRLWDAINRQAKTTFRGHALDVRSVAFSPDSKVLVSGSKDCTVKLWDTTPRRDSDTLRGHTRIVNGIVFSHDSRRLFSTSFCPPGKRQPSSTSVKETTAVKMWDVASGEDLSAALGSLTCNSATCVDISADGNILAIGTDDLKLWDMTAKKPIGTLPHGGKGILEALFSPDDKTLATHTGANDYVLRLWDVPTRKELIKLVGYGSHIGAIAFSPDGRMLAAPYSNAPKVMLWNTSDLRDGYGETPVKTLRADSGIFYAVAFSPDGKILATGSSDTTIKLWDLVTNAEPITMTGHTSDVHSVVFSPDGRTLASGGRDGTVRLWNLLLHKEVAVLKGHGSAIWNVAFSPDGHTLASSSFDSTIKLWRAEVEH